MDSSDSSAKLKKRYLILAVCVGFAAGSWFFWRAVVAPAKAAAHYLVAMNSLAAGETTETELLMRPEFQKLERHCDLELCFYHAEAQNTLLSSLHLAPRTFVGSTVTVRDGVVAGSAVFVMRDGFTPVTFQQVEHLPQGCKTDPCIQYVRPPSKILMNVSIVFDRQSVLRNRMPEFVNTRCLARLRGCKSYRELAPVLKELGVEEDSVRANGGR
jgi:hypothetical protein